MPVILFFHGNGDSVAGSAVAVQHVSPRPGYGAVLPEYRGYAGLPGTPNEQGLYRDARAARRWMTAQGITPARTIIIGYSLGSGVATQSAVELAAAGAGPDRRLCRASRTSRPRATPGSRRAGF